MAAKRKPVDKIEVAGLGIDEATDSFYTVRSLELPPPKSEGTIIQGEDDPAGAAAAAGEPASQRSEGDLGRR